MSSRSKTSRSCEQCGKQFFPFPHNPGRFCSRTCSGEARAAKNTILLNCKRCGKEFRATPAFADAKYCSRECYFPPRETIVCQGCGKEVTRPYSSMGKYCSLKCTRSRVTKTCPFCEKEFQVTTSKGGKYIYCSKDCRNAAFQAARVSKQCLHCGCPFSVVASKADSATFCSTECLSANGRVMAHCPWCNARHWVVKNRAPGGIKWCSNKCHSRYMIANGHAPGPFAEKLRQGYRTDIEAKVESVLQELGLDYRFEKKIGRFWVDFAIPQHRIAIECDGWRHATPEGQARDRMRDKIIRSRGWRILHIPDHDIRSDAYLAVARALNGRLPSTNKLSRRLPINGPHGHHSLKLPGI